MKAMAGAILLVFALLSLPAPLHAEESTQNPFPDEVKATGKLVIDRTEHDECLFAVPQVLSADVEVIVNTVTGTVAGTIGNGKGTENKNADLLVCGDDNNKRHIATLEFTGIIKGVIDTKTGQIAPPGDEGNVSLTVSGSGEYGYYPDMPEWSVVQNGGGFVCGLTNSNDIVSSCPLLEITNVVFPAQLKGLLTHQGELNLGLDWIAPYCELITRDPNNPSVRGSDWLSEKCPHKGVITWTNVVLSNQPPVIEALTADPAEPVTSDVVNITVTASDPEDDVLTYQWTVDGERQQAVNSPTTKWTKPSRGSHFIEVRVIDPGGGYDEDAISIWVEDPGYRGTQGAAGDDGTSTTVATSTTTTVPKTAGPTSGQDQQKKPSKGKTAGGAAVLVAVVALVGDAVRKGEIRGKTGELYRWGERKVDRGRKLAEKAERAEAIVRNPTILLKEGLDKAGKRLKESARAKRAERRFGEAQQKYKEAERKAKKVGRYAMDPMGTAAEEFRKSDRGKRLERRAKEAERKAKKVGRYAMDPIGTAAEEFRKSDRGKRTERRFKKLQAALDRVRRARRDPLGTIDRIGRQKLKEAASRLKARVRSRVLDSRANRLFQRFAKRLTRHTKGILDPKSAARLLRAMGDSRRFGREVRRNPALARHVIRRAGLSPLAVEALGGPRGIGRMLGRVAKDFPKEARRAGRFITRPKGWPAEFRRGFRRLGRAIGIR